MNYTIAPCCYFKTGVLFLDDDIHFVESLKFYFRNKMITYFSNDAESAMIFLKKHSLSNPLNSVLVSIDDIYSVSIANSDEEINVFNPQAVNISAIYTKIMDLFNNSLISLVVSDYFMPKMSGHDFLHEVVKKYIGLKSIMLTGEATMDQAIAMVNDRILDAFVKKNDLNFLDNLNKQIKKLQVDFFISCTKGIQKALPKSTQNILSNEEYIKIFFNLFSNDIEYSAILDEFGSMILCDKYGKYFYLILRSSDQIEDSVDIAVKYHVPLSEIKKLIEKKSILISFTEDSDKYKISSAEYIVTLNIYFTVIESSINLGVEKYS